MTRSYLLADLLPHTGEMILLDEVVSCESESLTARATVRPCLFSQPDSSLPNWVGLELMAQAVAAWAGWQARQAGESVKPGFLLGTRHYECQVEAFSPGTVLTIHVEQTIRDNAGMAVFFCRIADGLHTIAQASLNVYQPADVGGPKLGDT